MTKKNRTLNCAALCINIFLALFSLLLDSASALPATRNTEGYTVIGRVKTEALGGKGYGVPSKTTNVKVILNGETVSFIRPDGFFSFYNVPAGTHLIEVVAMGYFFSPVRVDVSARLHGKVQAYQTENRRLLSELVLEPLREEYYFEKREPFSPIALLKSPMGLMVGFMVVAVFLLPKLMESIDPEEMKRAQEEMRNQPGPSFANLLQGRTS
uniref:TSA: Wollemia nobilis Ref_Wollemi_Transcript_4254_1228 transcribed RNA sequence n=1 Tax=Wollemia nobilis TaxID=56998 RepID=A0A0C9SAB1_9CONI